MKTNMLLKALGAALVLVIVLIAVNLMRIETPTNAATQFRAGTASDPALQQSFNPAEKVMCSIAHISSNSQMPGKRIAFLQDVSTGKFICVHTEKSPSMANTLNVTLLPETFIGPLNVKQSLKLPDDTTWSMHWLSTPKYRNLWVLGLTED
jgi:hypothetical protein